MAARIRTHRDLLVYARAFDAATSIYVLSKAFPTEERYSLTDQVRRSSRSVTANIAEAWRKRRYEAAFIAKLSDAEAEAAETQVWIEHAVKCGYVKRDTAAQLYREYDQIIRLLVAMARSPEKWLLSPKSQA
ncbi:MAG: four helix bundle protein [Planctomycetota bacterium]|nr:four helix bundle protein [Planctomycetota bacterium]